MGLLTFLWTALYLDAMDVFIGGPELSGSFAHGADESSDFYPAVAGGHYVPMPTSEAFTPGPVAGELES